jgi:hypothetical protein
VLGRVNGLKGFHNVVHHELPRTWPSVALYRFESALVFYNAPYFKKRVLEVAASRPGIKWFVVDGGPINIIDSTGAAMLEALAGDLRARDPPRLRQPPHRGAGLAGTLRRESSPRRGGPLPHPQISRGKLRAWQLHGSIWRIIKGNTHGVRLRGLLVMRFR